MCFDYEFPEQRDNLKKPVKKEKSQGSEKAEEIPMIVSPVA